MAPKPDLTERQVLEYLRRHPDLLSRHPDLASEMAPPARALGDGVLDFQQFQVKNLQANARSLQERYDMLVDFCRDNLSVQAQVHDGVLRLIRARGLASLLEVLTLDLVNLFDVDIVRLAVESETGNYGVEAGNAAYSGIVLIPPGTVHTVLMGKKAMLVPDAESANGMALDLIFPDCESLARSYALLPLDLEDGRQGLLAFGVRYAGRFHANQGVEMLSFLARIVTFQLEIHLSDLSV